MLILAPHPQAGGPGRGGVRERLQKVARRDRGKAPPLFCRTAEPATISGNGTHLATRAAMERLATQNFTRRLWDRDATLWKQEPAHQKIIQNALGWLTVPKTMLGQVDTLTSFAQELKQAGFTDQVVLGMGGSSLCPDVSRRPSGRPRDICRCTCSIPPSPGAVRAVEKSPSIWRTRFSWFRASLAAPPKRKFLRVFL